MVHLIVCCYLVTYAIPSESSLYSCLNVKELLTQNRRDIWSLSDNNGIWIHNHLVCIRILNHLAKLAKWLNCVVSIYLYWAYSQMHCIDKYLQHSSIIWPVRLNGWVFIYELNGCGFEFSCCHLSFRYLACFQRGVPWHIGKYRVYIH